MLNLQSIIGWHEAFFFQLASGDYQLGKIICNDGEDKPYEVLKGNSFLRDRGSYVFKPFKPEELSKEDNLIWLKKSIGYPNPKPKPTGIYSTITSLRYEPIIYKDQLVANVELNAENDENLVIVQIFGKEYLEEIPNFVFKLKCLENKRVIPKFSKNIEKIIF